MPIIIDWLLPGITGVIIPFCAVVIGSRITKRHGEKQQEKNERIQREKLLLLLKRECEMFLYIREKNEYLSRKFISSQFIIDSPCFNVLDHRRLIELILELERVHENISIAVEASMGLISSTTSGYTKLPFWMVVANSLEKLSGKQTSIEKTSESINKLVKKLLMIQQKKLHPLLLN